MWDQRAAWGLCFVHGEDARAGAHPGTPVGSHSHQDLLMGGSHLKMLLAKLGGSRRCTSYPKSLPIHLRKSLLQGGGRKQVAPGRAKNQPQKQGAWRLDPIGLSLGLHNNSCSRCVLRKANPTSSTAIQPTNTQTGKLTFFFFLPQNCCRSTSGLKEIRVPHAESLEIQHKQNQK